jgi:hypothetical protein
MVLHWVKERERCQTFLWGALLSCLPLGRASQNLEAWWRTGFSSSKDKRYYRDFDSRIFIERIEVLIPRTPVHLLCCGCEAVERPRVPRLLSFNT